MHPWHRKERKPASEGHLKSRLLRVRMRKESKPARVTRSLERAASGTAQELGHRKRRSE